MFRKKCVTITCVFIASILFTMPVYASETRKNAFKLSGNSVIVTPMAATTAADQQAADEQERIGGTSYRVIAKSTKVMSGPGAGYTVLGTLTKGKRIIVYSINNGWAKMKFSSQTAYVRESDIAVY